MAKIKKNLAILFLLYLTTVANASANNNDQLNDDRMVVHMRINDGPFMIMVMASIGFVGLIVYFTYKTATMADGNKYSRL